MTLRLLIQLRGFDGRVFNSLQDAFISEAKTLLLERDPVKQRMEQYQLIEKIIELLAMEIDNHIEHYPLEELASTSLRTVEPSHWIRNSLVMVIK